MQLQTDVKYMQRALTLAENGRGWTMPNPMVGAVVVNNDGTVVGEGYHPKAGEPHAEIFALRQAGESARGATLYVTLEPCCHHGRTPPCTEAIIAAGIRRVVVACLDPNPKVSGEGISILKEAGIEVDVGVMECAAISLNEAFIRFMGTGQPFVSLKWAMSLDGKIATHTSDSRWISSEQSRMVAHQLRHSHAAILVGAGTVLADNPELTTRLPGCGRNPLRVILDPELSAPETAKVFGCLDLAPTVVYAGDAACRHKAQRMSDRGVEIVQLPVLASGGFNLRTVLQDLARRNTISVLVEGGSEVHGSFLTAKLADKVHVFVAPLLIGGRSAPGPVAGAGFSMISSAMHLTNLTWESSGPDIYLVGYPQKEALCSQG